MLAVIVLAAAACSGDEPAPATQDGAAASEMTGMDEMAGDGDHHGAGDHGSSQELAAGVPVPSIAIEVAADAVEGWNLRIRTTDFRIVPENVSTTHVDGEGHMHLYVDGEKLSRIYGEWHHIGALQPGEHEVRVELSSNNHSALAADGSIIDASAVIVATEAGGHVMGHGQTEAREAPQPYPSVSVELVDDPTGGWSLHAVPSNFRLAPENASGDHVDGEGHMHLYINGNKVARLYEPWSQMPPLTAGAHEIKVDLRTNDHAPLTVNGIPIETTMTLEVSEDEATLISGDEDDGGHGDGGHAASGAATRYDADVADAVQTIMVNVVDGAPEDGVQRAQVDVGSVVALMITSEVTEEVHVHGYDILRAVSDGRPAHFAFNAEIPGVFEVEFEGSGRLLLQLEVS